MENKLNLNHNVIIEDRKKLILTAVNDVISFDEETIALDTALGKMTIKGHSLHISNFNNETGDLTADGEIYAIVYSTEQKGGFLSKLFR